MRWPWTRGGESEILGRIAALEKTTEGLVTGTKSIRMEWEDVYDRMNRTMGRLNARIRKQAEQEAVHDDDQVPVAETTPVGTHAILAQARRRRA